MSMSATTRERILEIIEQSRAVSVTELSQQLHTTVANIRYHLAALRSDDTIEVVPPDPRRTSRGRPAVRYQLSRKSRPNDLVSFTADLLSILVDPSQSLEIKKETLRNLAHLRTRSAVISGTPNQRLTQTVDFLNQHAYQARWEARRSGPEIRLGNCPFSAIVAERPELCQIDQLMLEKILKSQVRILECYQPGKGIPNTCIFAVDIAN